MAADLLVCHQWPRGLRMEISDDRTEIKFKKKNKNSHWGRKGETTEQHGRTSKPLKLLDVWWILIQ